MLGRVVAAMPRRWRSALDQTRRDAAMVLRAARGRRAPFLVPRRERAPDAHASTRTPASTRRALVVSRLVRQTDDAVSVYLRATDGSAPSFEPGQFLTVELDVDGERLKRAYSISTSPLDGEVAITVKRIQGGRASTYVNERVREGDVLQVRGPSGSFTAGDARGPRHLVMLAGGSGITPIHSIVRTVLAREPETRVTLVYGNRAWADVIFGDALDALASAHPERLVVDHVLSDPPRDWSHARGMLDRAVIDARLDALGIDPTDEDVEVFVCGPAPMRAAAREALRARGVPESKVREEIFVRPERRVSKERLPHEPVRAVIRVDGREHGVLVRPGQTLLEAATGAGVPLAFSCAMGGCGTCMVRLDDGKVQMEEPNCLTDDERSNGMVLACVSRPLGPCQLSAEAG